MNGDSNNPYPASTGASRAPSLDDLVEDARLAQFRKFYRILFLRLAPLSYCFFYLSDLVSVPHMKWEMLVIRATLLISSLAVVPWLDRARTLESLQRRGVLYSLVIGSLLAFRILTAGTYELENFLAANLIAAQVGVFLPWHIRYWCLSQASFYAPYIVGLLLFNGVPDVRWLIFNLFYVVGTLGVSMGIRRIQEAYRISEAQHKLLLKNEVDNRGRIIEEKTAEALKLEGLSRQFSPQVIQAIREGRLDLQKPAADAEICALFIDVVGSTEKILAVDHNDFRQAIARYLDDVQVILMKHDVTIDKFLGDGVLAFCNDPVPHEDYIERVARAALEIRQRIADNQSFYAGAWNGPFQIRLGIASGKAGIGFFGNDTIFRSYTAIGEVMNLASRLCSTGQPDQITVSPYVANVLMRSGFDLKTVGPRKLKGFDTVSLRLFELRAETVPGSTAPTETIKDARLYGMRASSDVA